MKRCIIVGAGAGISRSVALLFGKRGYEIGLIARSESSLLNLSTELEQAGITVRAEIADAGNQHAMAAAFAAFGACDCLIYNASVQRPESALTINLETLRAEYDVNVIGAVQAVQAVAPLMIKKASGAILFTGGGLSQEPYPQWASLGMGKAALRNYAFGLDKELGPLGVRVSVVTICGIVAPGGFFDPDLIAAQYWRLAEQERCEGDREVVFAPKGSASDYNKTTGIDNV